MKCPMCKENLESGLNKVTRIVKGKKFKFMDVPSMTCSNKICEQVIIDSLEVEVLDTATTLLTGEELDIGFINYETLKSKSLI
jgi:hypothetical protein